MAEAEALQQAAPVKRGKMPLIIGVVMALVLGGVGFFVTFSGMLAGEAAHDVAAVDPMPEVTFVPIDPVVINLPPGSANKHLRLSAQLEVAQPHAEEVAKLMPRILDVMNGYLRAVETRDFEAADALIVIRAHLLRRMQMVAGAGRVRDLLVTEFVLN